MHSLLFFHYYNTIEHNEEETIYEDYEGSPDY